MLPIFKKIKKPDYEDFHALFNYELDTFVKK